MTSQKMIMSLQLKDISFLFDKGSHNGSFHKQPENELPVSRKHIVCGKIMNLIAKHDNDDTLTSPVCW